MKPELRDASAAAISVPRLVRFLFIIQLVSMGSMEMSGPFWPVYLSSFSLSEQLFAFAGVAVYVGPMVGIMLTSSFWGRVGDRFGHKLMMIRALVGLSATQAGLAYASDVWTILLLRCLQGACAGYIAPAQAYGAMVEAPERRGRLFAYLQSATNVGAFVGALVGGLILDYAAFFWINIAASALCAACAVVVQVTLPAVRPAGPGPTARAPGPAVRRPIVIRRSPLLLSLLAILGLLLASRMITQTPFSLYVLSTFHVDNWIVGLCYGLLALGFVVSASLWARYFEGRTVFGALTRMAAVVAACAGLTALAGLTRTIGVFVAIYFVWGALLAATTPVLTALVSRAAGNRHQGYVLGVAQSTMQLAAIAGIALGVWFIQAVDLQYTYFLVSLCYGLAALAVWARRRSESEAVAA